VGFTADGQAIGVEITTPAIVDATAVNQLLNDLGAAELDADDLGCLRPCTGQRPPWAEIAIGSTASPPPRVLRRTFASSTSTVEAAGSRR
jgi:hypothetical protein